MSRLTRNDLLPTDQWKTLSLTDLDTPDSVRLPIGPLLVPLSVWRARRAELIHREYEHGWPLGIWLSAGESPELIANDIDDFTVIALEYAGDKSYTNARLLRKRYGYRGELRAIGKVPGDAASYLEEAGFDARIADDRGDADIASVPADWFSHNPARHARGILRAA